MTEQEAALQLQASEHYRVLKRVPPVEAWNLEPAADGVETVRACIVDCETTGIGGGDKVIELAILPFDYERATARICAVRAPLSGFVDPIMPIPAEATAIHGITQAMVTGKSIADEKVAEAVSGAKLLLAHQARFDRGKTAKVWPVLDGIAWGCTWDDIDWRSGGYESGKLAYLLFRMGWFFDGHRALDDCYATLFAVMQPLNGNPALFALLQCLREPLFKVTMRGTPIEMKELLKDRDYHWHPASRTWWTSTANPDAEREWCLTTFPNNEPIIRRLPAVARHSDNLEAA